MADARSPVTPPWLKAGLALPLLVLNLWVLRQLLLPLAPFPALFAAAALIAFLLDITARWLCQRGLPRGVAITLVLGVSLRLVALEVNIMTVLLVVVGTLNRTSCGYLLVCIS